RGWQRLARRFPTAAVLLAALWPNLLAAFFNFAYNRQEIIARLDGAQETYHLVQTLINATAFPLGVVLLALWVRPVARGLRELRSGKELETARLAALRDRCLRLGQAVVGVGLGLWLLAGLAYPVAMGLSVGPLPPALFLHFTASLALCGLIAAVYP